MFERFTKEPRLSIVRAQREAHQLGARSLDSGYLLLGVTLTAQAALGEALTRAGLTADAVRRAVVTRPNPADPSSLDEQDRQALESIGIDLGAVRESMENRFGFGAMDLPPRRRRRLRSPNPKRWGHLPFEKSAKNVLEGALREATRRHDRRIGLEHIVLAAINTVDAIPGSVAGPVEIARLRLDVEDLLDSSAA